MSEVDTTIDKVQEIKDRNLKKVLFAEFQIFSISGLVHLIEELQKYPLDFSLIFLSIISDLKRPCGLPIGTRMRSVFSRRNPCSGS